MSDACKAKICGTTSIFDARMAADAGADFFGVVVEVDFSPRSLSVEEAEPLFAFPPVPGVALVFNMEEARIEHLIRKLAPFAVQFLSPADVGVLKRLKASHPSVELWQSVHLPEAGKTVDFDAFKKTVETYVNAGVDALLYDTAAVSGGKMKFGGTGRTSDWGMVKKLMEAVKTPVPVWLAGGIHPGNVADAIELIRPYGIDLCSGVEAEPGKKDPEKVTSLIKNIRAASSTES